MTRRKILAMMASLPILKLMVPDSHSPPEAPLMAPDLVYRSFPCGCVYSLYPTLFPDPMWARSRRAMSHPGTVQLDDVVRANQAWEFCSEHDWFNVPRRSEVTRELRDQIWEQARRYWKGQA